MKLLYIALLGIFFSPLTVLAEDKSEFCPSGYHYDKENHVCWAKLNSPCDEKKSFYSNTFSGCAMCPVNAEWKGGSNCQISSGKEALPASEWCAPSYKYTEVRGKFACVQTIALNCPPAPEKIFYNKNYKGGACTICASNAAWKGDRCGPK